MRYADYYKKTTVRISAGSPSTAAIASLRIRQVLKQPAPTAGSRCRLLPLIRSTSISPGRIPCASIILFLPITIFCLSPGSARRSRLTFIPRASAACLHPTTTPSRQIRFQRSRCTTSVTLLPQISLPDPNRQRSGMSPRSWETAHASCWNVMLRLSRRQILPLFPVTRIPF